MKSVIVSHAHPAISLGGAEIAAHRLFQRLRKDREDAHFVGLNKARGESPGPFGRFQRVLEMGEGDLCVRTFGMSSDRMEQNDLAEETWLVDYFADYEADVYHFHHIWNIGVGTLLRLRKRLPSAKFVCTLHELTAICAHHGQMTKTNSHTLCHEATPMACFKCFPDLSPLYFRTRTLRMQRVLDMFDLLISPSFFLRDRFEAWGVPPGRIHVLENGLPESRPAPRDDAEALQQKSKKFAYFGRATPTKGLDVLVRATTALMRRNPELDLTVDVFGVTPENVEKFWPDLEIPPNLVLKGAYAPADGVSLMRKYGWIVLPSIWWENAPLIFQEARAAGTPVISSDIGGMREKSQAAGLRFPVGDSAALADLMETLHGNAERLKSYKHSMPKPFTLGEYVARWRSLVGSASPSGQQRAATASAQSPTMQTLKTGGYAPFIHASQRTNALTIFHHIPKTAGSSLVQDVSRQIGGLRGIHIKYPKDSAVTDVDDLIALSVETFLETYDPARTKCISGHLKQRHIARIQEAIPNTRLIAFLRDPVQRVVSDYRYQRTPDHPPYKDFIARCPTIETYLERTTEMNKMWGFLLGEEDDIEAGIARLESNYAFIGLLELYDYSLNSVMLMHGRNAMPTRRVRTTKDTEDNRVALTPELIARISEYNHKDAALYAHFHAASTGYHEAWHAFRTDLKLS